MQTYSKYTLYQRLCLTNCNRFSLIYSENDYILFDIILKISMNNP